VQNTFNALARVTPSHLMDASLHDFRNLRATGVPDADGDMAFDEEPCASTVPAPEGNGLPVQLVRFDD
jgi:tRNA 2-thiocytidine biosynthesis protein TtcA